MDVVCALLPLFFIVKINRPLREKVNLFILMALGLLACACGLAKTALVKGIGLGRVQRFHLDVSSVSCPN